MLSHDVVAKIRQIELQTRRLLKGSLVGQYSSARKGSGFEFNQLREYQAGDDIRFIDWKSSARSNKLVVREFIEERTRTVILAVDVSASTMFSSGPESKRNLVAQIGAVLALVADYGKDYVALVLFSDEAEVVIPAGRGHQHVRMIMQKLFDYKAAGKGTSLKNALQACSQLKRSDALLILVSDFIDDHVEKELRIASTRYDMIALRCLDRAECHLPAVGLLEMMDAETGEVVLVDTGSARVQTALAQRLEEQRNLFRRCGIDSLDIFSSETMIEDLIRFFSLRMAY